MPTKCPRCGFENPANLRFCGECGKRIPSDEEHARAVTLSHELSHALGNHLGEWATKPIAQRASMRSDFEKHAGMSPAEAALRLQRLEGYLRNREFGRIEALGAPLRELSSYFEHARVHAREIEKDPKARKEVEKEIVHCAETAVDLAGLLANFIG